MKFSEMIELYSMLDGAGQERLLEEFSLQGQNGDMAALYLTGYLSTPVREDLMESAIAGDDPELLLAFAEYCAGEYGGTAAGRRRVHAICLRGAKSSCAPLLNKLGIQIAAGCGCVRNPERAGKFFRKAKVLGSAAAAKNLEFLEKYRDSAAVFFAPDPKKAVTAKSLEKVLLPEFGGVKLRQLPERCTMSAHFTPDLWDLKIS
ncbi:MAG: hypothetical protein IJV93_11360 [Lentisphaeria bacterium]|nr:hypothetical protein [Lentisphaeria bacterium]